MTGAKYWIIFAILCVSLNQLFGQDGTSGPDRKILINDIIITGNKITRENILLREMVFLKGDTIYESDLDNMLERSRENLLNLSIFNFVNTSYEYITDTSINAIIDVQERWYIWPTPIFEHGERNLSTFIRDPRWSKMNYGMFLIWNNFRGRNELLQAKIRLGYVEQYVLQYEKPNIGVKENHKISLSYSFSRQHRINYMTAYNQPVYFKDDDHYTLTSGDAFLAYTYRPQLYSRHRFRVHYQNQWVGDTVPVLNRDYLGNGLSELNYFKFDYVFIDDQRDSKIYPLEGDAVKAKIQRTGLGIIQDYPYGNWEAEGAVFLHRKLSDRFFITNAAKGKISSNKEVPYIFQNAFGYSEYMTSYEYFVINGTDYFLNKFIAKFALLQPRKVTIPYLNIQQFSKVHFAIYLNLTGDFGYVYNLSPQPTNYMENELQYSAGIGIDLVTYYDKVLRIEYSVNRYGIAGFFFHVETPFFRW
ncbi:MAG: hypothetical protein K9J30_15095 [Bacteroidales bacterium]|nr:hypothetical protein [Bacteroidales bacterium]